MLARVLMKMSLEKLRDCADRAGCDSSHYFSLFPVAIKSDVPACRPMRPADLYSPAS
jgi:hypothetical protein